MTSIEIKCSGTDQVALSDLSGFQGALKKISRKSLDKLKGSIIAYGFSAPIFVWRDKSKTQWIIDGHQRLLALGELQAEGYEIDRVPIVRIKAKSMSDAAERLLVIASQYGRFDAAEVAMLAHARGLILSQVPMQFANEVINFEIEGVNLDDYFEQFEAGEKKPKTIVCPNCGREFAL